MRIMKKNYTLRLSDEDRKKLEEIQAHYDLDNLSTLITLIIRYYIKRWKKIKLL